MSKINIMVYILSFAVIVLLLVGIKKIRKIIWFDKLKPGDKILVRIYSANCDCYRHAIVNKSAIDGFITASLDSETQSKCKECAFINSGTDSGPDITCWYGVDLFNINAVSKIR
jgi:hypothetical protein